MNEESGNNTENNYTNTTTYLSHAAMASTDYSMDMLIANPPQSPSAPPLKRGTPMLIARSIDISGDGNFTQGCSFSPDGLCVLTSTSYDCRVRLYNTPPVPSPSAAVVAAASVSSTDDSEKKKSSLTVVDDDIGDAVEEMQEESTTTAMSTATSSAATPADAYIHVTQWQRQLLQRRQRRRQRQRRRRQNNEDSWRMALSRQMGDAIRSYDWYPYMNSGDPNTCVFLCASRDQPVHLIDAYTAQIRATYRPYNNLDEMESPTVATFTPDGSRIIAGGFKSDRMIHVFHTAIPGRSDVGESSDLWRLGKTRRSKDGQKGLVSSIAFPPPASGGGGSTSSSVFAVGTYSPGSIYIYDDRMSSGTNPAGTVLHSGMCVVGHGKGFAKKRKRFEFDGDGDDGEDDSKVDIFSQAKTRWYQSRARGGITHLLWNKSSSEHILYSGSRRSDSVLAWDLRVLSGMTDRPVKGLASYERCGDTNQRLTFDLDEYGKRLFVASADESVKIYDVTASAVSGGGNGGVSAGGNLIGCIDGLEDVANGVSYMPRDKCGGGSGLLAVSVGGRRFEDSFEDSDEDGDESDTLMSSTSCDGDSTGNSTGSSTRIIPPGALELYVV